MGIDVIDFLLERRDLFLRNRCSINPSALDRAGADDDYLDSLSCCLTRGVIENSEDPDTAYFCCGVGKDLASLDADPKSGRGRHIFEVGVDRLSSVGLSDVVGEIS